MFEMAVIIVVINVLLSSTIPTEKESCKIVKKVLAQISDTKQTEKTE